MKIVCLGGGKGLSSVIKAWRMLKADVTAIVATTDDGGCSGRLRQAGSPVPWGDLRKAVVALASEDTQLVKTLSHRYSKLGQLSGHCVGNLMLEALFQQTGSVTAALKCLIEEMHCDGTILPMCEQSVELVATLHSGKTVRGETSIDSLSELPLQVSLSHDVIAPVECISAIEEADVIFIGPGSLITSILPVLLTRDIQRALLRSSAHKIFIHNIDEERGPARFLNHSIITRWIYQQCQCELSNELTADHLMLAGERYPLPVQLKATQGQYECAHDVALLCEAFDFIKDIAFESPQLRRVEKTQRHLRIAL